MSFLMLIIDVEYLVFLIGSVCSDVFEVVKKCTSNTHLRDMTYHHQYSPSVLNLSETSHLSFFFCSIST
jgi:hypothetical protein